MLGVATSVFATPITTDTDASAISTFGTEQTVIGANNVTISVNSDTTAHSIAITDTGITGNISIADGKTLTVSQTGTTVPGNGALSITSGSTLNINGSGTLKTATTAETAWDGNINANADIDATAHNLAYRGGTLNINGDFDGTARTLSILKDGNVVVSGTVTVAQISQWGDDTTLTINENATVYTNGIRSMSYSDSSTYSQTLNIYGTLNVKNLTGTGTGGADAAMFASTVNISSSGLLQMEGNWQQQDSVITTLLDNAGTADFATRTVFFTDKSTLTMRSGSAILTNSVDEQRKTFLNIANNVTINDAQSRPIVLTVTDERVTKADVTVNIHGTQELGGFNMYKDSSVTLNFAKDAKLEIGKFQAITATLDDSSTVTYTGDFFINITGEWDDDTFKIFDMEKSEIENLDIRYNGVATAFDVIDATTGGGYYVVQTQVPEPATFALIFGALGLGFVLYRRR